MAPIVNGRIALAVLVSILVFASVVSSAAAAESDAALDVDIDGEDITDVATNLRINDANGKRIGRFRRKEDLTAILFPGASPEEYNHGDDIPIWADLVTSRKTQVPFKYYDLPICDPVADAAAKNGEKKKKAPRAKNLGQKLQGYQKLEAPYTLRVKESKPCTIICAQKELSVKELAWLRKLVERHYRIHLQLDGLPILMRSSELNYAVRGYPVGFKAPPSYTQLKQDEYFLYNHIQFIVRYKDDEDTGMTRIIGFDAHPVSIAHDTTDENSAATCNEAKPPANNLDTFQIIRGPIDGASKKELPLKVSYSYNVVWEASTTEWADRWDIYMVGSPDDEVHLFSILNSLMIVVLLTGAVATIMIRTLKKDIATYHELHQGSSSADGMEEEGGWKLMHGDVFRPPARFPTLLCVAVGTGAQITMAISLTMLCALVGILSTMKKGQMLSSSILLYVLSGSVAGYVSARLDKLFNQAKSWKRTMLMTALACPALLVSMFLVLDIFLSIQGAATAVSFTTLLSIFLLWVFVSTPLVFVGSYMGCRAPTIEVPTRTNQIARVIPEGPWYLQYPYCVLVGGLLPFGNVCIELYFIMGALWLHQIYYVMGFLFAVMVVLVATSAEIAIVMCYLQLAAEDHQWWWRSFWNVASTGFYMFLYSLWYLAIKLELVGILPTVVYLTYMSMISFIMALCCGAVGTLSCLWFTKTIYKALKVD